MATLSTAVGMFISHVSVNTLLSRSERAENGLVKKKIMPEMLWLLELLWI